MLFKRSYLPEIMDDLSIRDDRIDSALTELKTINLYLGGNRVSQNGLRILDTGNAKKIILDIGSGASDILLNLKINNSFDIYSLDINPRACSFLKKSFPDVKTVCGNVFALPFKSKFDIIHASLFFHHFRKDDIIKMINSLLELTCSGIIINDLRRSWLAWLGISILTFLFSGSELVKNDGPLSVKRGFIKKDWKSILDVIAPSHFVIKRKWAFRWMIIIYK
jgi:SAM-dependent methyltransferase